MFFADSAVQVKMMYRKVFCTSGVRNAGIITVAERDRIINMDIIMDLFNLIFPVFLIFYDSQAPISVLEMMLIVGMPTVSLFSKLRSSFFEVIRLKLDLLIIKAETIESKKAKRRRLSLYRQGKSERVAIVQNKYFSNGFKLAVIVFYILHMVIFMALLLTQLVYALSTQGDHAAACDASLRLHYAKNDSIYKFYQEGCKIKIPFCKQSFVPDCDCAMFWVENDKSLTELPRNIVEEMRSVRTFRVLNCNLSSLPAKMENLENVVSVDLSYNKLQKFDVNMFKWKSIMHLNLKFNNISEYDEESMWNHPTLAALWVNSNKHFRIPRTLTIKSRALHYLVITNNSLTFPDSFGSEQMPVLTFFYAGGNRVGSAGFPTNFDTLSNQLVHLDISRCRLLNCLRICRPLPIFCTWTRETIE